jgi:superfamily II DNA/RNA helicase
MKRGAPPGGGRAGSGAGGGPSKLARRDNAPPPPAQPQQQQPDIDPETRQRMQSALAAAGFAAFRGAQEAAVAGALAGRDVFVLMPTGAFDAAAEGR